MFPSSTSPFQLILHSPQTYTSFQCEQWTKLSFPQPAMISIVPATQSHSTLQLAQDFSKHFRHVLRTLAPAAQANPCRTGASIMLSCQGHGQLANRCVLVIVGDGVGYQDFSGVIAYWTQRMPSDVRYRIVVLCPDRDRMLKHLPPQLQQYNVAQWLTGPGDAVYAVMGLAGLTNTEFRAFISYCRRDGDDHADDIFHTLTHAGYDVFLDHVDVTAGAHISDRIREEIVHKGVLLVLETPQTVHSQWVRDEVTIARANRLSILAVQFAGGSPVASISNRRRYILQPGDCDSSTGRLTQAGLQTILRKITDRQMLWLVRKQFQLQRALDLQLTQRGLLNHRVSAGRVDVVPAWSDQTPCSIQVTPRTAELADFKALDGTSAPEGRWKRAVLGPGTLAVGQRQADMHWLSENIKAGFWDEGKMRALVDRLADPSAKELR